MVDLYLLQHVSKFRISFGSLEYVSPELAAQHALPHGTFFYDLAMIGAGSPAIHSVSRVR